MKSVSGSLLFLQIFTALQLWPIASAYGPLGHEIVGAIAEERLANSDTATKIRALLGDPRLEKAAVIADEIKGWDKKGVDDPRSFHYSAHRNIDRQLRDFWRANPPTHDRNAPAPSHHWFHYTDVPVVPAQRYRDGTPAVANGT
jgi:S1/P1 Nuclease